MADRLEDKLVADSFTEQVHVVMPQHLNSAGRLFGGQLALWIDEVAGVVSRRHCFGKVTTAAIENLRFREPVSPNGLLVLRGRLVFVGNTSMEVRVDSFSEAENGVHRLINTAFVIMVGLDEDDKPRRVPGLKLVSEVERAEFAAGQKRRDFRIKLHKELYD